MGRNIHETPAQRENRLRRSAQVGSQDSREESIRLPDPNTFERDPFDMHPKWAPGTYLDEPVERGPSD
jgi:hypothetical protein